MSVAEHTSKHEPRDYFRDSLRIVFSCLADTLPGSSAAVYLHEGEGGNLVLQKSNVPEEIFVKSVPAGAISDMSAKEESGGQSGAMILSEEETARFLAGSGKDPDTTIWARPLLAGEDRAGLLVVGLEQKSYDEAQVQRALDLAARITQSNLILNSELGALHAEKTFLSDLVNRADTLDISSTSEALIDTLVRMVKAVLTFDRLTISTQPPEVQEKLQIDRVEGLEDDYPTGYTYATNDVIHGEVFRQARPMNIGRLKASGFKGRFAAGDFKKSRLTSFLGVPIMEAGVPRGTVALESTPRDQFSAADMGILKAIIQVYGTALCWGQRYQEVRAMATIDGLTQLLNHGAFIERLGVELERASRYDETMSFLMLDLDHFKKVNDTHGHLFGDYVLWQTAQLIRSCIRKPDIAGRYGGEEFSVIILNADKQTSHSTAERIRSSISEFLFKNEGNEIQISVSIGISEYPTDGSDFNALIRCADDAMYMVKHRGGNGVVSYSEELGEGTKGQ